MIGADNSADVYLNGEPIAVGEQASRFRLAIDITPLVHAGENVIAVRATHTRADRPAGLIGGVRVEFASGEPILLQTGNQWRAIESPRPDGRSRDSWMPPGSPPKISGTYGMAPWDAAGFAGEHRLPARLLRKEFAVDKKLRRATVYYAGLGLSELYLNGAKVGDHVLSPGLTDYDKHVLYVTFDVTRQLAAGSNAIGLMLGNGRYYAPRIGVPISTRNFGYPKAIVQLNLEFEDGTPRERGLRRKLEAHHRRPHPRQQRVRRRGVRRPHGDPGLEPRRASTIPNGKPRRPSALPPELLAAQMAEPLRVTETMKPLSVKKLKPGVFIFDMGQNMVGWCRLKVTGPKGTQVTLRHAETLNPDGSLYVANLRSAKAEDIYTLKGEGTEVYEPRFTYHGFRYRRGHRLPRRAHRRRARGARGPRRYGTRRRFHQLQRPAQQDPPQHVLGHSRQLSQHPHRLPAARRAPGLARRPRPGQPQRKLHVRRRAPSTPSG